MVQDNKAYFFLFFFFLFAKQDNKNLMSYNNLVLEVVISRDF